MYPGHPRVAKSSRRRRQRRMIIFVASFIGIAVASGLFIFQRNAGSPAVAPAPNEVIAEKELPKSTTIRTFLGDDFKNLYNSFSYPNSTQISDPPPVTGNAEADAVISALAEQRGYRLRSLARDVEGLADDKPLQLLAEQHWKDLKAEAADEGVILTITWAFRGIEDQQELFIDALRSTGVSDEEIIARQADNSINRVLETVAPPGYSRHHTGFTIDLTCGLNGLTVFFETVCYGWLSANNYERAKKHGWIPSYPKGAALQGPEPEAWEYIWVGVDALYET